MVPPPHVAPSQMTGPMATTFSVITLMPKPGVGTSEDSLGIERLTVERKALTFILRENPRGRFLRITEDVGGRRDTVIVPAAGLRQMRDALDRLIELDEKHPRPVSILPPA